MTLTLTLHSEADTDELGRLLAEHLPVSCVVALDGTLGAGKTRLAQGIATACGVPAESVTSPTFTLWQTYHGTRTIHHLDAYRVRDEDEFDALGVEECFEEDALMLIEWANRVKNCLPVERVLWVELQMLSEQERTVCLQGESFEGLFAALNQISRFVKDAKHREP